MAGLEITFHPSADITWAPLAELIGVLKIQVKAAVDENGERAELELYGLAFTDPDGETHVYLFTDEGKRSLITQLTGGIHIAPAVLGDLPH